MHLFGKENAPEKKTIYEYIHSVCDRVGDDCACCSKDSNFDLCKYCPYYDGLEEDGFPPREFLPDFEPDEFRLYGEGDEHLKLKNKATNWLKLKYPKLKISHEWHISNQFVVDVVGLSKNEKIAVEVGSCPTKKLEKLCEHFNEVYHWPYGKTKPLKIFNKTIK